MSLINGADLVVRRLGATALPSGDADAVREVCGVVRPHGVGEELGPPGARLLLTSGWACRACDLPNGRRQVVGFLVPGDVVALPDGPGAPYRTYALTRGASADAAGLQTEACRRAFARLAAAEARRHIDHIVRLAALTANQAMTDLLLELHDRLAEVGLAQDGRFPVPVSQEVLARSLGLSEVHTNRVLGQLRRDRLIELGPGWVALCDLPALRASLVS